LGIETATLPCAGMLKFVLQPVFGFETVPVVAFFADRIRLVVAVLW